MDSENSKEYSAFVGKEPNTYPTDQVKSIGGVTVGDVRYGIQTRGWSYGSQAVIQHVELTKGEEVLASEPNTEVGRAALVQDIHYSQDSKLSFSQANYLIKHINSLGNKAVR